MCIQITQQARPCNPTQAIPADSTLALEEKGLAFTFSAVRAAYAAGGDCESDVRVDVRNLAAFVRDPAACVTCFLLPLSCTMHLKSQVRPAT